MGSRFFCRMNDCLERNAWIEAVYDLKRRCRGLEKENAALKRRYEMYEKAFSDRKEKRLKGDI